jgi:hypothetical protein
VGHGQSGLGLEAEQTVLALFAEVEGVEKVRTFTESASVPSSMHCLGGDDD